METVRVEELTEQPLRADAIVHRTQSGSVRPNRALAERLAFTHRVAHRLFVLADQPRREYSPEEKLLRAIFGEAANAPEGGELAVVGETLEHGRDLIKHPQETVSFRAAASGEVEAATRSTSDMPAGCSECITVIMRWPGPLAVGDELWEGARSIGLVDGIVDDGHAEPRLYLATGDSRSIVVERRLPTALQSLRARGVGAYDPVTSRPVDGEAIRDDQLVWLANAGGRALVSEFAVYKGGDTLVRTRLFESLVKLEPIAHPWDVVHPPDDSAAPDAGGTATSATSTTPITSTTPEDAMGAFFSLPPTLGAASTPVAPPPDPQPGEPRPMRDIFHFFEKPKAGEFEPLVLAKRFARAAGLEIDSTGSAISIAIAELSAVGDWSHGRVQHAQLLDGNMPSKAGLLCAKIFGPVEDYKCVCGKYARMKHRGVVCEQCGVEVIQSKVRRERFAHYELVERIVPSRYPTQSIAVLPILPAGLRARPDADINQRYREVIEADLALRASTSSAARQRLTAAVDAVFELALRTLCDALVPGTRRTDYSGSARVLVGERRRVPFAMLGEILAPILYGVCESNGYTTTVKSAKKLVRSQSDVARDFARMALHDRVLLFASAHTATCVAASVEIGNDPIIEIDRELASRLGVATGDVVSIHVPISDDGQAEARRLGSVVGRGSDARGWLHDVATASDRIARLVEHATRRSVDPCDWAPATLLVGGYPPSGPPAPPPELGPAPVRVEPPISQSPDLDRSVDEFEWSVRTANTLANMNITTIRELVQRTESEILKQANVGRATLREIKEMLAEIGLGLGMKP